MTKRKHPRPAGSGRRPRLTAGGDTRRRCRAWLPLLCAAACLAPAAALAQPAAPARPTSVAAIAGGREFGARVEFEGVVREVITRAAAADFLVFHDGAVISAVVAGPVPPRERLLDARVRFRGVPQSPVLGGMLPLVPVHVDGVAEADILSAAPAEPFRLPIARIAAARALARATPGDARVHIRGTVVLRHSALTPGRRVLHVQDDSGVVIVDVSDEIDVPVGDGIDAA